MPPAGPPPFAFGKNWRRFLRLVNPARVEGAAASLRELLGMESLAGRRFLDAGCGSGLFSFAARRLGAAVTSFDRDPEAVACAEELKARHAPGDEGWRIRRGCVLDEDFLRGLGPFDVVYSWGVLHHTGDLSTAMARAALPVAPGGLLALAIYNDQGWITRYWKVVKHSWNRRPWTRPLLIALHLPYLGGRLLARAATGRLRLSRGMSLWRDFVDWLGGWPFETMRPEGVVAFYRERGFDPERVTTRGRRHGCNEFCFRKPDPP